MGAVPSLFSGTRRDEYGVPYLTNPTPRITISLWVIVVHPNVELLSQLCHSGGGLMPGRPARDRRIAMRNGGANPYPIMHVINRAFVILINQVGEASTAGEHYSREKRTRK